MRLTMQLLSCAGEGVTVADYTMVRYEATGAGR